MLCTFNISVLISFFWFSFKYFRFINFFLQLLIIFLYFFKLKIKVWKFKKKTTKKDFSQWKQAWHVLKYEICENWKFIKNSYTIKRRGLSHRINVNMSFLISFCGSFGRVWHEWIMHARARQNKLILLMKTINFMMLNYFFRTL